MKKIAKHINEMPDDLKSIFMKLKAVPQRADFHPEGDVLIHTMIVALTVRKFDDNVLLAAAIMHDIGKIVTTTNVDGKIQALGHEVVSTRLCLKYAPYIQKSFKVNVKDVMAVVAMHMDIKQFDGINNPTKKYNMAMSPQLGRLLIFRDADDMSNVTDRQINKANQLILWLQPLKKWQHDGIAALITTHGTIDATIDFLAKWGMDTSHKKQMLGMSFPQIMSHVGY